MDLTAWSNVNTPTLIDNGSILYLVGTKGVANARQYPVLVLSRPSLTDIQAGSIAFPPSME